MNQIYKKTIISKIVAGTKLKIISTKNLELLHIKEFNQEIAFDYTLNCHLLIDKRLDDDKVLKTLMFLKETKNLSDENIIKIFNKMIFLKNQYNMDFFDYIEDEFINLNIFDFLFKETNLKPTLIKDIDLKKLIEVYSYLKKSINLLTRTISNSDVENMYKLVNCIKEINNTESDDNRFKNIFKISVYFSGLLYKVESLSMKELTIVLNNILLFNDCLLGLYFYSYNNRIGDLNKTLYSLPYTTSYNDNYPWLVKKHRDSNYNFNFIKLFKYDNLRYLFKSFEIEINSENLKNLLNNDSELNFINKLDNYYRELFLNIKGSDCIFQNILPKSKILKIKNHEDVANFEETFKVLIQNQNFINFVKECEDEDRECIFNVLHYLINIKLDSKNVKYIDDFSNTNIIDNTLRKIKVYSMRNLVYSKNIDVFNEFAKNAKGLNNYDLNLLNNLSTFFKIKKSVSFERKLLKAFNTLDTIGLERIIESYSSIMKVCDLTLLTEKQFNDFIIDGSQYINAFFIGSINKYANLNLKINYEELRYLLLNLNNSILDANLLNIFKNMNSHNRIIKLKEFINISKIFKDYFKYNLNKDDLVLLKNTLYKLYKNMGNTRFHDYFKWDKKIIKSDDYESYVFKIILEICFDNRFDVDILRFKNAYKLSIFESTSILTLNELNEILLSHLSENKSEEKETKEISYKLKELQRLLNVDDDFIEKYSNNCIDFMLSPKFDIFKSYLSNDRPSLSTKKNLKLITIADIINQYNEVKFDKEELQKEIGLNITINQYHSWIKTDSFKYKKYVIQDASDYETIMTIGSNPIETCMNYRSGMYSDCLIANFDSCKKILKVYENGKYVMRAILRLTQSFNNKVSQPNELKFKNVLLDNKKEDKQSSFENNEEENTLTLFVEYPYSYIQKSQKYDEIKSAILEFLYNKCKNLNANLIFSYDFGFNLNNSLITEKGYNFVFKTNKYVQINKSKNGYQYLDSFGGQSSGNEYTLGKISNTIMFKPYNVKIEEELESEETKKVFTENKQDFCLA